MALDHFSFLPTALMGNSHFGSGGWRLLFVERGARVVFLFFFGLRKSRDLRLLMGDCKAALFPVFQFMQICGGPYDLSWVSEHRYTVYRGSTLFWLLPCANEWAFRYSLVWS